MSKKLELSFKKMSSQSSSVSEPVRGKKRIFSKVQVKSGADESPQIAGPSPRKESKTVEKGPSPLNIIQLRDTDDDMEYDNGDNDDLQGPDDLWQGPLEKRLKVSLSDANPSQVNDFTVLDALGEPMFDPTLIHHPNSTEWFPSDHVAEYVLCHLRHSLDKATRNKLRSECPRPSLPFKITSTPVIDPNMVLFFSKFGIPENGLAEVANVSRNHWYCTYDHKYQPLPEPACVAKVFKPEA
ncbi:hypothetical protein NDU88_002785 [Pleurodeles waltl]|uniref:Uncharacterized protein n=1 Tax=Pleurodeles waltl TaxID=8319 RepID=A0AAV7PBV9_PLEWA|nr:hypothetical protein NDU88_002785 [Pleurodeles waltl]